MKCFFALASWSCSSADKTSLWSELEMTAGVSSFFTISGLLAASERRENVRRNDADSEEHTCGGQQEHYDSCQHVCPQRTHQLSHDFFVVNQHIKEHQCRRHGQDRDHVDDQHYIYQREPGDKDDDGSGYGTQRQYRVERLAFSHGEVQAVRFAGDFAEGVGGRG